MLERLKCSTSIWTSVLCIPIRSFSCDFVISPRSLAVCERIKPSRRVAQNPSSWPIFVLGRPLRARHIRKIHSRNLLNALFTFKPKHLEMSPLRQERNAYLTFPMLLCLAWYSRGPFGNPDLVDESFGNPKALRPEECGSSLQKSSRKTLQAYQ